MPDVPGGADDWTTWIIVTIMGALASLWGIVLMLAKFIEGKYRTEVTELKNELAAVRVETKQCQEDRTKLFADVAMLQERVKNLEPPENKKG